MQCNNGQYSITHNLFISYCDTYLLHCQQEGQHPLTGQCAPPISGGT